MAESAFEKRVKRRIFSRGHTFYVSAAPGLLGLLEKEIQKTLGVVTRREVGGVGFDGRLPELWKAALSLRFANRILLRVAEFKATDFRKLEAKCRQVPWELWLPEGAHVEVVSTMHRCRLYHSAAVSERVASAVEESLGAKEGGVFQRLCVRGEDDRIILSLDATGVPLYKREVKTHGGRAPIRETLASAILKMAGYTGEEPLVDPMCGTGTFSFEAAMVASKTAPGLFRAFAFESWPSFRPSFFAHLKRELLKNCRPAPFPIFASDADAVALARLEEGVKSLPFDATILAEVSDFFDLSPERLGVSVPGVLVFNPPYGKRISGGGNPLVEKILKHLFARWADWRVAIAVPSQQISKPLPKGFFLYPLAHGGLDLSVLVGRIEKSR